MDAHGKKGLVVIPPSFASLFVTSSDLALAVLQVVDRAIVLQTVEQDQAVDGTEPNCRDFGVDDCTCAWCAMD